MISSTSADYVNTGHGVQNFQATTENQGIKGVYLPFSVVEPVRTETIRSGTWITVGFGVSTPEVEAVPTCDEIILGSAQFLELFTISATMDGIEINNLFDPLNPEYTNFMYTEEGYCFGLISFRYYIPPLSVGSHSYHFVINLVDGSPVIDSFVNLMVISHGR